MTEGTLETGVNNSGAGGQSDRAQSLEPRYFDAGSAQASGLGPVQRWPYEVGSWHRVSKKYVFSQLILDLMFLLVYAAYAVFRIVSDLDVWLWVDITCAALAVISLISALLSYRRTRAIGYMLREDDFLFTKGLLFYKIIAVPYGRLQLVEIKRGPLLRILGLASLQFVTAATGANVTLPGLEQGVAERLRDELIRVAEVRRSGI